MARTSVMARRVLGIGGDGESRESEGRGPKHDQVGRFR